MTQIYKLVILLVIVSVVTIAVYVMLPNHIKVDPDWSEPQIISCADTILFYSDLGDSCSLDKNIFFDTLYVTCARNRSIKIDLKQKIMKQNKSERVDYKFLFVQNRCFVISDHDALNSKHLCFNLTELEGSPHAIEQRIIKSFCLPLTQLIDTRHKIDHFVMVNFSSQWIENNQHVYIPYTIMVCSVFDQHRAISPRIGLLRIDIAKENAASPIPLLRDEEASCHGIIGYREKYFLLTSNHKKIAIRKIRFIGTDTVTSTPSMVTTNGNYETKGKLTYSGGKNWIHMAWLDNRNENQSLFYLFCGAAPKNYEIYYRAFDAQKELFYDEKLISKGMKYAYNPSIASDGDNVVIAWTGWPSGITYSDVLPTNIYYAYSRDQGRSWSKPICIVKNKGQSPVADREKWITYAFPKIFIHENNLHLVYTEICFQRPNAGRFKRLPSSTNKIVYQYKESVFSQ